jgi:hypothetical protein
MLSKNDADLLYVATGIITFSVSLLVPSGEVAEDPFVAGMSAEPLMGDTEAMASLTRSCLLNFAFADSKSKSVAGTSTFLLCEWLLPLNPPLPPLCVPVWLFVAGCRDGRALSLVLISLTFFVRLSTASFPVCAFWPGAGGNLAIAAATAAVAA